MAKIFYENDCNLKLLEGKTIAIIGYGSQGHAHALNLRDSGVKVIVAELEGGNAWNAAKAAGFDLMSAAEASKQADIIMILLPDDRQAAVYNEHVAANITAGKVLAFAHGFNIHFGQITPPADADVIMVAPKGPGHTVRYEYEAGKGVPCLTAIHQDASGKALDIALAYAAGVGGARAGVLQTTFKEETETDLFGEQAVLCGGVSELMKAGFDTLVQAGYAPEIAYFECVHEVKLIVDMIYRGGLNLMRYSVSDTAEYGDYQIGERIITADTKNEMKKVLAEIQDGTFARNWIDENKNGRPNFNARRKAESELQVEKVGAELRKMYKWDN